MKQKLIKFTFVSVAIAMLFFAWEVALVQSDEVGRERTCQEQGLSDTNPPDGICDIANPAPGILVRFGNFGELLVHGIGLMLLFAGGVAVLFFMIGGFQYIAARGNEEASEQAKKTMSAALIGAVLIIMAYSIVTIVNTLVSRPPTSLEQTGVP